MSGHVTPVHSGEGGHRSEYARPARYPHQSRSVQMASHGMVATSHPLAAQVGLDILQSGGNAADAGVATSAMMGLVEPMSCGIGGDLFVIYWDHAKQSLTGLNASGRSPQHLTRDLFLEREISQIPLNSPLSWSVPGCVDGWQELLNRHGSRSLKELLAPSIQTAQEGFPVPEVIAGYWSSAANALSKWPGSAHTYLPGGAPPAEGALFKNPELAESYRLIAEQGIQAFYEGPITEKILACSDDVGGFLSHADFTEHTSEWIDPVSTNYRGYDVWELPPNGQGIAALEILNILEQHNIAAMGPKSVDWIHLFTEAKKLAFADRARFYADMSMADVPVEELISKEYARRQNQRIDMQKAATNVAPGDPRLSMGDTIYLTVVDKDRNCCSLIQSNFHGFGSKIAPPGVGFVMQNRGALFTLEVDHPNVYEPGKRPFHTIIPAMVTKDGKPWFCFGVMGGDMQPQGHVQVLVNMLDFGMNVQMAGDLARVSHTGSPTPTGLPEEEGGGELLVEPGIDDETIRQLEQRGHRVRRAVGAFGGYQGIRIDPETNILHGATESRKDGAVVGY
ncbi:MAG: gamma-glutamyltransferase [Planctomycetaceae bacterium]|nr:gamma-glutamyltransferase [Planctomycetaceae bacterium]